jgi:lipopolysaccharide/colanic/teichoic acid biosynthesis glycosyltransferase
MEEKMEPLDNNNISINRDALKLHNLQQVSTLRGRYEVRGATRLLRGLGYLPLKRIIDISLSLFLLPVVVPIIIVCAVLMKLDSPGPIFYLQERTGIGGKRFKMFKLRSMVQEADSLKKKYASLNTQCYPDFKIPNDPRVTRIGRILRKTSLDEIPQIFNVLRGTMSIVGPRPTSFSSSTYNLWHTARLEIKPGMTGLWQVSGRCCVDFSDRNRLDIAYIQNLSFWLDLKIMFRTIGCVIRGKGAE